MIDLHVHTNVSDNSLSISEVIKLAKDKGITHLAITDHDTTQGLRDAIEIGHKMGVCVVPGIEVSAYDYQRNKRAHILGLYVKPEHPALDSICAPLVQKRQQASCEMMVKLIAAGYDISWEEVQKYQGETGVFKQHIMHALMSKGYCDSIYGNLYKKLFYRGSSAEAPGIAYVSLEYVDAVEAIQAVRKAGGIPVLAHPGQMKNFDAIDQWVELGLEGIEVYHPSHSQTDIELSLQYAQRDQLVITGGSDFHGFYAETTVELGCPQLKEEHINELINRKEKHSF